jgi:hypothetical protein
MRLLIATTLILFTFAACEYRQLDVRESEQQIRSLKGVNKVSVFNRNFGDDLIPEWHVTLTIKTPCGTFDVEKRGTSLQGAILDAVEAARCVQECK